jgi:hypothetical protein
VIAKQYVRKEDLRPGERVRMVRIYEGRYRNQGDGTKVKIIFSAVLKSLREHEARHLQ